MIASVIPKNVNEVDEGDVIDFSGDWEFEDEDEVPFKVASIELDFDNEEFIFVSEDGRTAPLPFGHMVNIFVD